MAVPPVTVGIAAVAAAGAGVTAYALDPSGRRLLDVVNPHRPSSAPQRAQLERYAASGPGTRGGGEWRDLPGGEVPAGARSVPIALGVWCPFAPEHVTVGHNVSALQNGDLFKIYLRRTREVLARAGRGDEDPRAALWLWMLETGGGRFVWGDSPEGGGNIGNRKIKPFATQASILGGNVWTTNRYASSVYLLVDRIGSFDSYPAYASWDDSTRDEADFFTRNHYDGVLPAYRAGGLEGCMAAHQDMHNRGYSPGVWTVKAANVRAYWRIGERFAGEDWVR